MILGRMENVTAYRMHSPRWAVAPISGAGAAKHGGRVNRRGMPALYLALSTEGAINEYQQVSSLLPPGTLISYQVTVELVVDFRAGYDSSRWGPIWEDFFCDWRELWFNQHVEPPSWLIGDEVVATGAKGILFQSRLASGGTNVVLFVDTLCESDSFTVFDPNRALPKNQDSWK